MEKKSIAKIIILSILTCGIYSIYWTVVTTNDIEYALGEKSDGSCKSGGIVVLLTIITCGIYGIYWYYKEALRLQILAEDANIRPCGTEPWVYVVLSIFGLEIVSMALLQDEINRIVDANDKNSGVVVNDAPQE